MSIRQSLHNWMVKRNDRKYVSGLDAPQTSDLGMSKADLAGLLDAPADTRERMEAMARAHGLDPDVIGRDHWRETEIAQACSHCGERKLCGKWFKGKAPGVRAEEFCPNAGHYAQMASETVSEPSGQGVVKRRA